MAILVLERAAYLTLWRGGLIMIAVEVVAPAEVEVGAGAAVRAHIDHAAPAVVETEVDPHQRTVDMYHGVLLVLHLVHPTVLKVEVYLQIGWTSTLRISHNVL